MIRALSTIGHYAIVVATVIFVLGGALGGYGTALMNEPNPYLYTSLTAREAVYAAIGAFLGLIIAGVVLGIAATLYDIRDSLRLLVAAFVSSVANGNDGYTTVVNHQRREPRINGGGAP
jgi:hypothetical protein